MIRSEYEVARIIFNVFEYEDNIDPRTVARMFQYMGEHRQEPHIEEYYENTNGQSVSTK